MGCVHYGDGVCWECDRERRIVAWLLCCFVAGVSMVPILHALYLLGWIILGLWGAL